MPKEDKEKRSGNYRMTLVDVNTHKVLWGLRVTPLRFATILITVIVVLILGAFMLLSLTSLKTFIPGYPDARSRRTALQNSMTIDSLEGVIKKWEFYSDNLRRVVQGEDPVKIDSLIKSTSGKEIDARDAEMLHGRDTLLRQSVKEAEAFGLTSGAPRQLPIEGIHFFTPLKGVVSQGFDRAIHPYIDITAPANSVVAAVLDGTVINAGWSDDGGYTITIQHEDNLISIYKHNQTLLKRTGDRVTAGTPVALVGNTGSLSTGDHLHFELWYRGEAVDPSRYISF
ncbi:MAG: M23 family metallopeptidase [Bacteroidales bacterium]|nr:M23 family metallopeptidase [Bacteroidales bacterium]MBQ9712606.1 M23 family metallopeptidase [Bacteroidales bacterium]